MVRSQVENNLSKTARFVQIETTSRCADGREKLNGCRQLLIHDLQCRRIDNMLLETFNVMATEPVQHRAIPEAAIHARRPLPRWSRPLAIATVAMFCISTAFPVVAGLSKNTGAFPKWWGIADVVLAFVLAAMVLTLMAAAQGINKEADEAAYRAYRVLIHGILVMGVVFFLAGDRITWINCLTGFGWRTWLLLYALPSWFTLVRASASK